MFGRPKRLTKFAASAIALLSTAGALAFLGTGAANATVQNNGNNRAYQNLDGYGCQVVVGDEADPARRAIGEVDITHCPANYHLVVRVYLEHQYYYANGSTSSWQFLPGLQYSYYGYQFDAATGAFCGYDNAKNTDYWYTVADISFNGGQTWSGYVYSYEGSFETGC